MDELDYHHGRPIIEPRRDGKRIYVFCPFRHLLYAIPANEWAGSFMEAKASDSHYTVRCYGTLPDDIRIPEPRKQEVSNP